ncbi:MAG TPA: PIN domain nuclease [Candidatus Obscuribacterales bacterium]|nr:PIN domain nuclease [Candidatus Obscuribacterales bacterium]
MLPEDLIIAHGLNFNRDPFDSLIVATAKRLSLPLISGDNEIIDSGECRMFWN